MRRNSRFSEFLAIGLSITHLAETPGDLAVSWLQLLWGSFSVSKLRGVTVLPEEKATWEVFVQQVKSSRKLCSR